MSGKVLRFMLPTALLLAGCAIFPSKAPAPDARSGKEIAPSQGPSSAAPTKMPPRGTETRSAISRNRPAATPAPASPASSAAASPSIVTKPGAPATQPVPLFRQAIVLANVRAAMAGLPSAPQAEFRQGLLTLSFREATPDQISTAVDRAMSVPEVSRVQVIPAP